MCAGPTDKIGMMFAADRALLAAPLRPWQPLVLPAPQPPPAQPLPAQAPDADPEDEEVDDSEEEEFET